MNNIQRLHEGGDADSKDKENRAFEMRKAGASYEQIAKAMDYHDASGAAKAVKRYLRRLNQESSDEVRLLMLEQLNDIYRRATEIFARESDPTTKLRAQDQLLKVQERMSKLLGLDAPVKTELSGDVSIEVRAAAVVERLRELKAISGEMVSE